MIIILLFFVVMTASFVHEYRKGPTPSSAFYIALYITGLIIVAMFASLGIIGSYYFTMMLLLPIPTAIAVILITQTGKALKKGTGAHKVTAPIAKHSTKGTATPPLKRRQVLVQEPRKTLSRSFTHFSREASLWALYLQHEEEAFWSRYEQILAEAKQQRNTPISLAG